MQRRGFSLTETAVVAGLAVAGAAVAGPIVGQVSPEARRAISLRNMQIIGAAGGAYRLDNDGYLPIEGLTGPRRGPGFVNGWCNWSAGGKNNNGWWYTSISANFDVEAADRPLNPYAAPGVEFYAPPAPARLPAADPARLTAQAPVFKDPSNPTTRQRRWPMTTPGISTYDDIGTSYLWNAAWWNQLAGISSFEQRMNEGTRRIAREDGARPDRFVWFCDQTSDIVMNMSNPQFQMINDYGDVNKGVMLIMDGHAGYFTVYPGSTPASKITPNYSVWFE